MPLSTPPLLDELLSVSAELDQVIGEMTGGRPSQPRFDDHADQVVELAGRLVRAARGPGRTLSPARPA